MLPRPPAWQLGRPTFHFQDRTSCWSQVVRLLAHPSTHHRKPLTTPASHRPGPAWRARQVWSDYTHRNPDGALCSGWATCALRDKYGRQTGWLTRKLTSGSKKRGHHYRRTNPRPPPVRFGPWTVTDVALPVPAHPPTCNSLGKSYISHRSIPCGPAHPPPRPSPLLAASSSLPPPDAHSPHPRSK